MVIFTQANKQATAGKLKHSESENESTSTAGTLEAETTNKTKRKVKKVDIMRRTENEIKEAIKAYFEENEEEFNAVIEELDSYNGRLEDDRYYDMEMFDEYMTGMTPSEVLQRTFYGGDDDTKDKNGIRGEFNPNRAYFFYNGYGNLCSTDYKDYSSHLDDYFVDDLIENAGSLYEIPDEVQSLIDEMDENENGYYSEDLEKAN